jgi:hypothetical protein
MHDATAEQRGDDMSDDVVDRIEHDHREVEVLFAEFDSTKDRALALQIGDELEIHTQAEEKERSTRSSGTSSAPAPRRSTKP